MLWVDLRTAFPSLWRPILLHRLRDCGLGLGLCRLILRIFDMSCSVVCLCRLASKAFNEQVGVREGAVESPHQFDMYIGDLRRCLEEEHPNICRLLGVIIAALLYADDAALPADSAEDLQGSAELFEKYCNDRRLFISTPTSFITVFHDASHTGAQYSNGQVLVDGHQVTIKIYDAVITAVDKFKYLGVVFDEFGSAGAHFESRLSAFLRAGLLLLSALRRLPGYAHDFLV